MTYFKSFCRFCISPWRLTSGKNFMVIHPVVQGAVLHLPPPIYLQACVKTFTCKPLNEKNCNKGEFTPPQSSLKDNQLSRKVPIFTDSLRGLSFSSSSLQKIQYSSDGCSNQKPSFFHQQSQDVFTVDILSQAKARSLF